MKVGRAVRCMVMEGLSGVLISMRQNRRQSVRFRGIYLREAYERPSADASSHFIRRLLRFGFSQSSIGLWSG